MSLGPIFIDIAGTALSDAERERLAHPAVGGVVLFARNFADRDGLRTLVAEVHSVRTPPLLVAVDQEGGRVQRFRAGFTRLPSPAHYGDAYDADPRRGLRLARWGGEVMAAEVRAAGPDLSFAPVADLRSRASTVIGERAFHREAEAAAVLAGAFMAGMRDGGMAAVAKHFPGHGSVSGDTHHECPADGRDLESLALADMLVFERLVHGGVAAVMAGHVVYPAVDDRPAGFSEVWLRSVLRGRLGFAGAVFSDDLSMAAAAGAGSVAERASRALEAGCDAALVCNAPEEVAAVLDRVAAPADPARGARLARLHGRPCRSFQELADDPEFRSRAAAVAALEPAPELDLCDDGEF